ncbi:MAG: xanthine dehydrogenase molybdopterin binding subunit, partial [Paracoccaceae bacterium]|nr:xanthine dehydrogenase molybdopterin binding subunit [Paracoccaceae bacterium]
MSVAKPLPHDAATLHVTGAARYIDDIPTPAGTLHLAFGLSQIARGQITAMTLDAVRRVDALVRDAERPCLPLAAEHIPLAPILVGERPPLLPARAPFLAAVRVRQIFLRDV